MRFTSPKPALYALTTIAAALLLLILLPNSDNARAQQAATLTFRSIVTGLNANCGILRDNGETVCWGRGYGAGYRVPVNDATFTSIALGSARGIGLRTNGYITYWRAAVEFVDVDIPSVPRPTGVFKSITHGSDHACGLRRNGTAVCWGLNPHGEASPPTGVFTSISAGRNHSCGLRQNGAAVCWGRNGAGEASPPSGVFTSITAGYDYTCGLRQNGAAVCWGSSHIGFYANQPNAAPGTPTPSGRLSPPAGAFTSIDIGGQHGCGLRANGAAVCWGKNKHGQASPPAGVFTSITAGWLHSCGLRTNGTAECWGHNDYGGQVTVPTSSEPPTFATYTPTPSPSGPPPTDTPTLTPTPTATPTPICDRDQIAAGDPACVSPTPTATPTPVCDRDQIAAGDPACVSPTPTATPTPVCARDQIVAGDPACVSPTPTATATPILTSVPTTTRPDVPILTPTRTATRVPTPGSANARITQLENQARTQQEQISTQREQIATQQARIQTLETQQQGSDTLIDELRDIIARITFRLDALDGGPSAATPTPTHTPTPTNTPVTSLEATPTPTSTTIPTLTPTRVSGSTLAPGCIGKISLGWLTGTWHSGCQSAKTPPTAKAGTRYARYYTFTLDAPGSVTVSISSTDVRNAYLYLLEGRGDQGSIVNRGDAQIRDDLTAGTYTIEATTYDLETAGSFTLSMDISTAGVSAR